MSFLYFMLVYLAALLPCCISSFEPDIDKYENLLVVDGRITNIAGSCMVNLSRTYPYDQSDFQVIENAQVKILDDAGNETILLHSTNGTYYPENQAFKGVTGRRYKILIDLPDGSSYESSFERMKDPVPVDSVYYRYLENQNGKKGLQILIDTHDPLKTSHYYAWDYQETWEFTVPYESSNHPGVNRCFKNVSSKDFMIQSSMDFERDEIRSFPVCFIDNTTNRLSIKYSILVRQYVLTEETYVFYKNLKEINEQTGSIFDKTPVTLTGNIHDIKDPSNPVLGNFQVSGESTGRIFINGTDVPDEMIIPTEYEFCQMEYLGNISQRVRLDSLIQIGWSIMDSIPLEDGDTMVGVSIRRACFDCSIDGDKKIPDYWNE